MANPKPKLGVLALTLELYESLVPELRGTREAWLTGEALPALPDSLEVVFRQAVYRRADIEAEIAFLEQSCDALMVVLLTYSPSQLALPALVRTRLPIIVWNTQELLAVDERFDTAAMIDNHGVHGTQDLCNVLRRAGVKFEYVTSHLSDADPVSAIEDFAFAAAATRKLANAKLGLIGYAFPGMGDFALDTTHLAGSLGCQWVNIPVEEYILRSLKAPADDVHALVATYRDTYDVDDTVDEGDILATAAAEIALCGIVADYRLSGLTYQFTAFGDDERTETVPFVAISRMMADGVGFGGEGDLIATTGSLFLNTLAEPASFCECFTTDFAGNSLFMSHMGESNAAMARIDRRIRLLARSGPITRTRQGQLQLVTVFEPGPATLCALTLGPCQRWQLIVSQMRIPDWGPVAGMESPHYKLTPKGDVRDWLTGYAKAGGPHHAAVCFGDARRRLRAAAAMIDADYVEI